MVVITHEIDVIAEQRYSVALWQKLALALLRSQPRMQLALHAWPVWVVLLFKALDLLVHLFSYGFLQEVDREIGIGGSKQIVHFPHELCVRDEAGRIYAEERGVNRRELAVDEVCLAPVLRRRIVMNLHTLTTGQHGVPVALGGGMF